MIEFSSIHSSLYHKSVSDTKISVDEDSGAAPINILQLDEDDDDDKKLNILHHTLANLKRKVNVIKRD